MMLGAPEDARPSLVPIQRSLVNPFRLPRTIQIEGGAFSMIARLLAKDGRGEDVARVLWKIHQEADKLEFQVHCHRILRGLAEEERSSEFAIIMDFDDPHAFTRHFEGSAISTLFTSDLLVYVPEHTFYRNLD